MAQARIFIDGEAGTTGLGIRQRLESRADVALVSIPHESRKDPDAKAAILRAVDCVVLCLPDAAAREMVAAVDALGADGPKVLDASTAHRTADGWTYGFPELDPGQAEAIASARRVGNPGCYATGAIALLHPLVVRGMIAPDMPLTINAVSGYSGGGRTMIEAHEAGAAPRFELYALGLDHKHIPEIMRYAGLSRRPLFVPSVARFKQGMIVSIPLHLDQLPGRPSSLDIADALAAHYVGARYVRVAEGGTRLEPEGTNTTNDLELSVVGDVEHGHAVLLARLDNLGKGASGAAVQNLALMLGLAA